MGSKALNWPRQRRPDLILMDRRMPVLSGLEAVRQLRQTPELREMPIIAVSASVSTEEQAHSRAAGYDDFLPKPLRWPDLAAALAQHLGVEWQYEAKQGSKEAEAQVGLPPDEAQQLYTLAQQGLIVEIRERLDALERRGPQYSSCVAELRQLARRYRLREIRAVLEPYVQEINSAG